MEHTCLLGRNANLQNEPETVPDERIMKVARIFGIALLGGLTCAVCTSSVFARNGARDPAITRCLLEALRRYPAAAAISDEAMISNRTASYKACMTASGFRP